jgi:hypothetical protein
MRHVAPVGEIRNAHEPSSKDLKGADHLAGLNIGGMVIQDVSKRALQV